MRKTWTLPLQFFVREWILTRKKKIAVIAWAHTVGQWQRDRMAVGIFNPDALTSTPSSYDRNKMLSCREIPGDSRAPGLVA